MSSPSSVKSLLLVSDLMLLAVAVVWGTSYGVVKSALLVYPVLGLLALRFGITFLILLPALRQLRHAAWRDVRGVLVMSVILLAIFLAETFGILMTRAANAAFLISLCVVLTPMAEWVMLKRRPTRIEWLAVALSLLGAALLTSDGELVFNRGDALILLAALLRAIQVCVAKRVMQAAALPALSVTALQAGVVTLGSVLVMLIFAPQQWQAIPAWSGNESFWGYVAYLVLACTLFAFFAQNYAIKRSSPTRVALLMGSEPAFGALFASLWLGERIPALGWVGGGLIVVASLLATLRWQRATTVPLRVSDAPS